MANGNFAGGDGTALNPYLIEDALDLNAVRNGLSKSYKLIKNIDLGIAPFNIGEGWTPIGNYSNRFLGKFNGDGYIIKNLYINNSNSYNGLFGYISNALINNIGIKDVKATSSSISGGLIGQIDSSTVNNSYSTGTINGNNNYIGGLIGTIEGSTVTNSYTTCSVSGNGNCIGGLIGQIYSSTVNNSYSTGKVIGTQSGGIIGLSRVNSVATNLYWDKETSNQISSACGEGKTTLEMKTPSTFVGWNTQKLDNGKPIWIFKDGQYPKLWFEKLPNKYILKQDSKFYTIKSTNYDSTTTHNFTPITLTGGLTPTVEDYTNFGFDDFSLLTQNMTVGTDTFKPIDKFDKIKLLEVYKSVMK